MQFLSPVAIPVFSAANYHAVMSLLPVEEQDTLPHDQYLAHAATHAEELRQSGVSTRHIAVTPDALLSWCERHARPLTREAISLFAADQLAQQLAAEEQPVAVPPGPGD